MKMQGRTAVVTDGAPGLGATTAKALADVNCAGIATPGPVLSRKDPHDIEQVANVANVNLLGTLNVMTLGAELLADQDPIDDDGQRGIVMNTAPWQHLRDKIGQAAYAASKGGIHSLTITAARDVASHGIRVNTVPGAPGSPR